MTIASVSQKPLSDPPAYRIQLSNGWDLCISTAYYEGRIPECGAVLSEYEESNLRFASLCFDAEQTALRLVRRAEQQSAGLTRKLQARGFHVSCVRLVVQELAERGLVDDLRFARLWLQSRLPQKVESPRRLEAGLRSRGIEKRTAAAAIESVLTPERELVLLKAFIKKYPEISALKSEGFSATVREMLREEG
ncbi:hypothetical protein FACS1894172_04430 [Spirochaetia bacterium]|nr:hypothetical protein FACS1894164_18680 [Spirochaetia bacterium]GHU30706.1 hypothetical protein FACS1894172_04430 [Spirochaetia bacterium]